MTREGMAELLSRLARRFDAATSPAGTLQVITAAVVETIPGAEHAGVALRVGPHVETVVATDPVVQLVDQAQYEIGEGPCLDVLSSETAVSAPDLVAEARWPSFTPKAVEYGVRSMLSLPLSVEDASLGALNTYSSAAEGHPQEVIELGRLFATHAAIALSSALRIANLQDAVASRDLIGQAKGILMGRYKITAAQAFEMLVRVSQRRHMKLREVAERVVETGLDPLDATA